MLVATLDFDPMRLPLARSARRTYGPPSGEVPSCYDVDVKLNQMNQYLYRSLCANRAGDILLATLSDSSFIYLIVGGQLSKHNRLRNHDMH